MSSARRNGWRGDTYAQERHTKQRVASQCCFVRQLVVYGCWCTIFNHRICASFDRLTLDYLICRMCSAGDGGGVADTAILRSRAPTKRPGCLCVYVCCLFILLKSQMRTQSSMTPIFFAVPAQCVSWFVCTRCLSFSVAFLSAAFDLRVTACLRRVLYCVSRSTILVREVG